MRQQKHDFQIEVASSRSESYENDSRSPKKVVFTSLEEDLKRRDFTINAMAMDTHPKNFGKIYDPFNGQGDLSSGLLKTPLDPIKTFSDDPLRMMRAAYFSSKLNFKLDSNCRAAIKDSSKRISIVSWERIRDELIKILSTAKPSIGLVIMQKTGLLKIVFPEIDFDKVDSIWGLDIVICTSANSDDEARELLREFNMPFYN